MAMTIGNSGTTEYKLQYVSAAPILGARSPSRAWAVCLGRLQTVSVRHGTGNGHPIQS